MIKSAFIIKLLICGKMRKILLLVAEMLVLAGCSHHPPSAAQFMNAKVGANVGLGLAARIGDIYDSSYVYSQSDKASISLEEGYWNLETTLYFGLPYFTFGFEAEDYTLRSVLGVRTDYWGAVYWIGFPFRDSHEARFPQGFMLVQQLPISEAFRIGLSEHISRNSYRVIDDPGCCTFNDVYGDAYNEVGAGAYIVYSSFSAEFRYGNEMNSSNNRFYFVLNYRWSFPAGFFKKSKA